MKKAATRFSVVLMAFVLSAFGLKPASPEPWGGAPELTVHIRPLELAGRVSGDQADYYWLATADTTDLELTLETDNSSLYFNLFGPGELPGAGTAGFVGSRDGTSFVGELESPGATLIQVYLMRNAARRDETANYSLTITPR